jgi:predicted double-glycine peptidase
MRLYRQTTKYTCGAASLAMVINHFRQDFLLNVDNEFDIWQKTACLPTKGSSIYGLAIYAHKLGIPLKVVVGKHTYKFPGHEPKYKTKEIEIANFSSEMFYMKAKKLGIEIEEGTFTLDDAKKELAKGNIILLRLIIGILRDSQTNRRNPHYLAVYGYKDSKFLMMDPRRGPVKIDENIVKEAFDKVTEIKRDHRMIVFG